MNPVHEMPVLLESERGMAYISISLPLSDDFIGG